MQKKHGKAWYSTRTMVGVRTASNKTFQEGQMSAKVGQRATPILGSYLVPNTRIYASPIALVSRLFVVFEEHSGDL